ncbi:adenomatous polyposis coli protein-like [Trichogramma pretiosum]|uniref:adenomatous polyposis coli protein-like n=1 Tax=Trichogramma pretiosum TaxID=7493 RepID=UPI0006C986DA|nr:adenomatous polyposis coli protein-like [Trichogramma pretiosum]
MSREDSQTRQSEFCSSENKYEASDPWRYAEDSDGSEQNRTCSSPVDEPASSKNFNKTHNVKVQTDKSTLLSLKQDKRFDTNVNKKCASSKETFESKKMVFTSNFDAKQQLINELEHVKLKKTGLQYDHENASIRLSNDMRAVRAFDEISETDSDQPTNYSWCYDETKAGDESSIDDKLGISKAKSGYNKESRNKKEIFSSSRSFKEIFNFFKDRDKKRSNTDSTKLSEVVGPKFLKIPEIHERKSEAFSSSVQSSSSDQEKDVKNRGESEIFHQTPLMFSRCSSLGSLSGFEINSINDDKSSFVSDFSRRTSGVVSPSEIPDSPAPMVLTNNKSQTKSQLTSFGTKKPLPSQFDKFKNPSYLSSTTESASETLKRLPVAKMSIFEDHLTSFKDESTPNKLHSMAASSLSSLTIDDDDDCDVINKILGKDKMNLLTTNQIKVDSKELVQEATLSLKQTLNNEFLNLEQKENVAEEEKSEVVDLTPFEEQILDQCIRTGIAKWIKQNVTEIKPFSWDLGITCHATQSILTSKLRKALTTELISAKIEEQLIHQRNLMNNNTSINNDDKINRSKNEQIPYANEEKFSSNLHNINRELNIQSIPEESNGNQANDHFITYEEYLLDQCIRKGMAKLTKRHVNDFKPFSWDVNRICLTTKAMMIHSYEDSMYSSH